MIRGNRARAAACLLVPMLVGSGAAGRMEVSSFSELKPYLDASDVHVVMTPGTYRITPADVTSGLFPEAPLLSFTGTNSVYDFTGVTIEVSTAVFQSFGNIGVQEVAVLGDDLVLKNLTLTDIGNTRPRRTALGVLLDGSRNRVEGFHLTVRGSQPYGYGDIFGKGSGYVIKHFKHSAILIRGDSNHLKDCKVYHRAYGHGIFCQGSIDTLIEGCYVEGEMRTSDDVLAEAGTGSPADEVDFMTVWGYTLQPGWMFSLQEDGIRAYNTGYPDPDTRNTRNMHVIDCTVKNMRSGVTIGFCDNTKYIEGCTVLGVESGYWPGSNGRVVDSCGNAQFGPLLVCSYQNNRDMDVDLTVLDHERRYGNEILAYIGGSGHDLTFRGRDAVAEPDMRIMLSGIREGIRQFIVNPTYNDFTTTGVTLDNRTLHPVVLAAKSSSNSGQSSGPITDDGTNNSVTPASNSSCGGFGVLQTIEGEDFCGQSGAVITSPPVGISYVGLDDGDWIRFDDLFFGSGPNRFDAEVVSPSGGALELRLNSRSGELIGTCTVGPTGSSWTTQTIELAEPRGKHDLYLVFRGAPGAVLNLDAFKFRVSLDSRVDGVAPVAHWSLDDATGSVVADMSGNGFDAALVSGAWVAGKSSGGLDIDAGSDSVTLPAAAFAETTDQITVALWAYGDTSQPRADSIFYAVNSDGDRVLNIHLPWNNSTVYWDAGFAGGYDRIDKTAQAADFKGAWNHWAFTKNARTGIMKIYLNGSLWHTGTGKSKQISDITSATLGSQISGSSYDGAIDDVRLYPAELSALDIADLYASYFVTGMGTPHAWLDQYGLVMLNDYDAADLEDVDGDGMLAWEEFQAGTHPTHAASVFQIMGASEGGDEVVIDWPAVAGKAYRVLLGTNLNDGAWAVDAFGIPGVEPSCTHTIQTDGAAGFIHVEVETQ